MKSARTSAPRITPPLVRPFGNDEVAGYEHGAIELNIFASLQSKLERNAARVDINADQYALERRGTAATLLAINELAGEDFYRVHAEATLDPDAARSTFEGRSPVIDVQTHLVDAAKFHGRT